MININQTSEQTKILIPRSNINGDIEKNNYVTEDELQEILKEYNSIPYLIIDYLSILDGDWQKVYDAISNNQPYLIYHKRHSDGYLITVDSAAIRDNYIDVLFCREAYNDNTVHLYYTIVNIYPDRLEVQRDEIIDIPTQFKTINGNDILGEGDIEIDVDLDSKQDKLVSGTNIKTINNTSVLGSGNIAVQPSLVSGSNIKTINGSSLLGSGDITIVGSGSEILYLYKSTDDTAVSTHKNHNINIRNKILSLTSTEQYPIIILKDWYNDTICNNVYARNGYVEIQCCNSRIFGEYSELTDERYELNDKGVLVKLEDNTFASKAYVDEQVSNVSGGGGSTDLSNYYTKGEIDNMVGDIETILDNLIGNN